MVDPRPSRGARLMVGVLVATLNLGTAPAFGAKEVIKDARQDVLLYDHGAEPGSAPIPAPDEASSDITRTVIAHRAHRLVVKIRMSGPQEHKQGTVMVIITPKTKFTGYFFAARRSILLAEKRVRCDGISNSFDALNGLVSNSIPRRCLGNPRWVRVRVGSVGSGPTSFAIYLDDARRAGLKPGLMLTNGPRLRKG